ncbi:MAG: TIGR02281 family clan AA aspartic protease [Muribaculaceae bacterium]|nr:TIGR02281 family clan AA aspartic protease [Muribaculaceae bacterium]
MKIHPLLPNKTKRLVVLLFLIFAVTLSSSAGDHIVKMKRKSGVYYIPCVINGVKKEFIFDTGAAKTSLSQEFANELLAKRALTRNDFKGTTQTRNANGVVDNNATVLLKQVKVGNRLLKNVEAIIAVSQKAPLLLGLNVIDLLGDWTMRKGNLILHDYYGEPVEEEKPQYISPADITYIDENSTLETINDTTADDDDSQPSLRVRAYKGDPEAQYQLGMIYLKGVGVDANPKFAVEWFRMAATQGHIAAQLALADCYTYGWGVEIDESQVEYWRNKYLDVEY